MPNISLFVHGRGQTIYSGAPEGPAGTNVGGGDFPTRKARNITMALGKAVCGPDGRMSGSIVITAGFETPLCLIVCEHNWQYH